MVEKISTRSFFRVIVFVSFFAGSAAFAYDPTDPSYLDYVKKGAAEIFRTCSGTAKIDGIDMPVSITFSGRSAIYDGPTAKKMFIPGFDRPVFLLDHLYGGIAGEGVKVGFHNQGASSLDKSIPADHDYKYMGWADPNQTEGTELAIEVRSLFHSKYATIQYHDVFGQAPGGNYNWEVKKEIGYFATLVCNNTCRDNPSGGVICQ